MSKHLLSPLAARRRFRRLLGTAAGLTLLLGAADAQAQTVYGLGTLTASVGPFTNGQQGLVTIDAGTGFAPFINTPISGVTAGQTLVGIDFRPNGGQLYALGYNAATTTVQVYTLSPATSVATPVGAAITLNLGTATDRIGFDFNPTVDRIRVVSTNDADVRLNPVDGTLAGTDGALNYAGGSPANPGVGSVAYTNSFLGSTATTLYDYDELNLIAGPGGNTNILSIQNPPNSGTLTAQLPVMFNGFPTSVVRAIDLDIYYNPDTQQNQAFLTEVNNSGGTNFYSLDLSTGAATRRGNTVPAGTPFEIRDIAAAPAAALTGQLAFGVTSQGVLVSFDTNNPSIIRSTAPVTGLAAGQTLVGTDFRPNTGQLFGLGYDFTAAAGSPSANLYTIDRTTGVATQVPGSSAIALDLGDATNSIGFDFNPTVDRIRVVSTNDRNYRLNPVNGAIAAPDGNIAYAASNPNAGTDPTVGTGAYVNSFVGATTTALYTLDHALGLINFQNPPNNGTQDLSRTLTGVNGAGVGGAIGTQNDFDVYYDGTANVGYLTAVPNGQAASRLYRLAAFSTTATTDQAATDLGAIGAGLVLRDISIPLSAASTVAASPAPVAGRLLYAVAGGNLISFDSNAPGIIRSAVNFGGGITAGQTVVGVDFRPADGQLYALGYDPALANPTNNAQLYTVNLASGGLTAVGTAIRLELGPGTSQVGFDFNPTVDRIRVVSTNNANYRLNPTNGAVASMDPNLNGTAGTYSATAYTNNQSSANTTAQYVFDSSNGSFTRVTDPNNGVIGGPVYFVTGTGTTTGGDFDIYNTPGTTINQGFIATAASSASANDNLYIVGDFGSPFNFTVSNAGPIGQGTNVSGLSAFISAGSLLTWNGSVSTDWGTAANWTPAQVPTAGNDVTIPGAPANQPVVGNAQQARNVTLTTGASLTTANGGTLSVGGNFTNNGGTVGGAGTGAVVLTGVAIQTLGGTSVSNFQNLTVGPANANTAGPVGIRQGLVLNGNLTVGSGTPFVAQTLTLLSGPTGTAYVVNNGTNAVINDATMQRYITSNLNNGPGYRHYSSPVNGNTVADFATAGFTPVVNSGYNTSPTPPLFPTFPNVFTYDQSRLGLSNTSPEFDKGFQSPNALTDPLLVGTGYTVNINASQLVDFVGTLNNGAISRTGLARGPQATAGYQFLGNPYPSALNYDVVSANSAGMEPALYVFKSNGQYTGAYASYNNGVSANGGTNVLPVAQGFFVRTAAGQTGAVNFTNAARLDAPDNTPFQRTAVDVRPQLALTLRNATAANQTVMYFEQGATAGFDSGFDAHYLPASNGLLLATEAGPEALAINGLPALSGADAVLPLQVAAATTGAYTLAVDNLANLPAGYHAYLRDALTNAYTDLAATPAVSLNLAANAATGGRYAVVFTTQNLTVLAAAPAQLAQLATVYPNPAHATATLLLPVALRNRQATPVSVVDNLGRTVLTRTLAAGAAETLALPLAGLAPGVYSVQARTAAGLVVKRLVVE
ncbi:DUF4394 domain-containing protein [Hymenobacter ruricola]|uniref:DUF4394 domain-containing protein n=1 Tax=Hymenobacter ruricola TaxID=2791023 RepID=A0ABS0I3H7_9BACT|nr:DUF4394 domain-containing protein [Hymenobacter ruricola]MBF9221491.1 DUF4394 domain-containing protein [Hymenobacter ruricola]